MVRRFLSATSLLCACLAGVSADESVADAMSVGSSGDIHHWSARAAESD